MLKKKKSSNIITVSWWAGCSRNCLPIYPLMFNHSFTLSNLSSSPLPTSTRIEHILWLQCLCVEAKTSFWNINLKWLFYKLTVNKRAFVFWLPLLSRSWSEAKYTRYINMQILWFMSFMSMLNGSKRITNKTTNITSKQCLSLGYHNVLLNLFIAKRTGNLDTVSLILTNP